MTMQKILLVFHVSFRLSYLSQDVLQVLVSVTFLVHFFFAVGVNNLVSKGTQRHVRSLWNVEQLLAVRFGHGPSKQWPQLKITTWQFLVQLMGTESPINAPAD